MPVKVIVGFHPLGTSCQLWQESVEYCHKKDSIGEAEYPVSVNVKTVEGPPNAGLTITLPGIGESVSCKPVHCAFKLLVKNIPIRDKKTITTLTINYSFCDIKK